MIKSKKKAKGLLSALGVTLVAALAFSALAAGSAQGASWHVKNEPYSKYAQLASHYTDVNQFEMTIPSMNFMVKCYAGTGGYINESTKLKSEWWLQSCAPYSLPKRTLISSCVESNPSVHTQIFEGTGNSVSNTQESFEFEWQKEKGCPLPLKTKLSIPSLSLSYGPPLAFLEVTGSGSGQYVGGTLGEPRSMTVATINHWMLLGQPGGTPVWGWY